MNDTQPASQVSGRAIGLVYLSYLLSGVGLLLMRPLIVGGNAAATAANILAHESTYRAGVELGLVGNVLYLALTGLFYRFFSPINKTAALLAILFSVAGCIVQTAATLLELAPLLLLKDAGLAAAFTAPQLQAAALATLKLYNQSFSVAFVLFGCFDFFIGYLIVKSGFMPRAIGIWMMAGGAAFFVYLWPPLMASLSTIVLAIGGLAEVTLLLWFLIKGSPIRRRPT